MRSLAKFIPCLVVLGAAWLVWPSLVRHGAAWLAEQRQQRSIEDTVRSTAFVLRADKWITFELPPQAQSLRILTNAAVLRADLPPRDPKRPRKGWRYVVEYDLIDGESISVEREQYHLRTRLTQFVDTTTGKVEGVTWFRESTEIPTQTRTIQIPIHRLSQRPTVIRLRLADRDASVSDVVVRVYMRYERSHYDQPYAWSRLSEPKRLRLTRASVYPADLLSPLERQNLLRWDWTAVAPEGQDDVDYEQRQMYQREEPQPEVSDFLSPDRGVVCEPGWPKTISMPSEPGNVRISFSPDASATQLERAQVRVRYHVPIRGSIIDETIPIADLYRPIDYSTAGGLIELEASEFVVCNVTWTPDGERPPEPLTLATSATRMYGHVPTAGHDVRYSITHVGNEAAPLRVCLRRLEVLPQDAAGRELPTTSMAPEKVAYECLSSNGEIVKRGTLMTSDVTSRYDRGSMAGGRMACSEPVVQYFDLPGDVTTVRFRSDSGRVAVTAFTRPPSFPRISRLPEEREAGPESTDLGRTWFLIRPDDFDERIAGTSFVRLRLQRRPPDVNTELLAGEFEYEALLPEQNRRGRFVLATHDPTLPLRDDMRSKVYRRVPIDREVTAHWLPDATSGPKYPRLVYNAKHGTASPVQITTDRQPFHEFTPRSSRGEVELPAVTKFGQPMRLAVRADTEIEVYIQGLDAPNAPVFIKRFVYHLGDEAVEYRVTKLTAGVEYVVIRPFFAHADDAANQVVPHRHRLKVNLVGMEQRPAGPSDAWTLQQRVFDLGDSENRDVILLDGTDLVATEGERCVISLREDLPPGDYRLRLQMEPSKGDSTFVSVFRLRPLSVQPRREVTIVHDAEIKDTYESAH